MPTTERETTMNATYCPNCNRREGWDGHAYGPCSPTYRVTMRRNSLVAVRVIKTDDLAATIRLYESYGVVVTDTKLVSN